MNWTELKEELSKPLDKAKVKTREGSGSMKLSYVDGFHVIDEANRIFGFGGWHRVTQTPLMVQCEQDNTQKWRVSYTCQVCVTVDGVSRDGVGFGQGIDKDLGKAHESAIKEAETDAMKRAFMTFGYTFGLALYDKSQTNVSGQQSSQPTTQQSQPVQSGDYVLPLKAMGLERAKKSAEEKGIAWDAFLEKCKEANASTVAQCSEILNGMAA